jgi:predicted HNH restriction endonuclease
MFDAHHLQPLAAGIRESRVDDLVVLCPTCHRWAHVKAEDKLSPITVQAVARAMARPRELFVARETVDPSALAL